MSFFAMLAAGSALIVDVPQPATFRDWTVSCDNMRYCEAQAAHADGAIENAWVVRIARGGTRSGNPTVLIFPAFDVPTVSTTIRFDGQVSKFGIDTIGNLIGDPALFLRAMAKARRADIIDADQKVVGSLAVNGAAAALRWIDDRQRRVGTISALIAKGGKPESTIPALPALPEIKTPTRSTAPPVTLDSTQIKTIRKRAECFSTHAGQEFFRLDEQHSLGLIGCGLGAYQGYSVVVLIDNTGAWSRAPIEQQDALWEGADEWDAVSLTTADYGTENFLLSTFAKGRGLTDCGMSASWVWDGEVFRLASYEALDECRGGPPGEWLPQWQTRNDPRTIAE